MPRYEVYGLTIASTLPLPELVRGEGEVDILITIGQIESAAAYQHSPIRCADVSLNRVHLTWGGVGDLVIEDGQRITVLPAPNSHEDALRLFVLGAGMGVLLHQRGLLILHASGVAIDEGVVGFVGAKGWGKSTTAATLHQRGHALVSDELLVLRFDDHGQPWVMPGPPQIRLWADALVSTGGDPESSVQVKSGIDKFNVSAPTIAQRELPLYCVYLLDAGEELSIQPMSSSEAFFGIIPHLYVCRFGTSFLQATGIDRAFSQLNQTLKRISVKRLVRRRDLAQLPDVVQRVEQDFSSGILNAL